MKGGNAFNCYDYKGDLLNGSGKDSGLYCLVNKRGSTPEISHITVFWSEEDKEDSIPMTSIEPLKPVEPTDSAKDNQNNLDFLTGDNSFNSSKNEDDIIYNNQELVSDNGYGNIFVDSTNNPKTGDVGIMLSIIGIVGSAIGLVMNRKKNQSINKKETI